MKADSEIAISVRNVSKVYNLYDKPQDRLKQMLLGKRRKFYKEFWALRDITFEVKKGEVLGIIGVNGAGKSTLLQILAGTLPPSEGEVFVKGRTASLLELGSGFNPEFTGRENVYLNGAILGLSREEIEERFDEIVEFADIGEYIDQPVKFYSSGMYVRLAFAVQACVVPEVLIVDEALSVGDIFFQQKCHARMEKLIEQGTAIVMVSHNMQAIEKYSTRVMLLDRGSCIFLGKPNEAVERYYLIQQAKQQRRKPRIRVHNQNPITTKQKNVSGWPQKELFSFPHEAVLIGNKDAVDFKGVVLSNSQGEPCSTFEIGDIAVFYYEFKVLEDFEVPVAGVVLTNKLNINIHGKNALQCGAKLPPSVGRGTLLRFKQTMQLSVSPGEYTFQIVFSTMSREDYKNAHQMDYLQLREKLHTILRIREAGRISVRLKNEGIRYPFYGYADLKGEVQLWMN